MILLTHACEVIDGKLQVDGHVGGAEGLLIEGLTRLDDPQTIDGWLGFTND